VDEPRISISLFVKVWIPDHVLAPFKRGIVAPDVPVAVEQPVAPLDRPAHGILEDVTLDDNAVPVIPDAATFVAVVAFPDRAPVNVVAVRLWVDGL
jgi:hypothetical protein